MGMLSRIDESGIIFFSSDQSAPAPYMAAATLGLITTDSSEMLLTMKSSGDARQVAGDVRQTILETNDRVKRNDQE